MSGKSYTVKDDKPPETYGGRDIVHELGTCYLHPEYHAIESLFKEYDNENKRSGIPSRGVFGTHMNEEVINRSKEKAADFTKWAMAEAEESSVPKAFHFINDKITGGISFMETVHRYAAIHKKIFGKQKKNFLHGFLSLGVQTKYKLIFVLICFFLRTLCVYKLTVIYTKYYV